MKDREKRENPNSEISDLVIDRLLLGYLFSHVSSARRRGNLHPPGSRQWFSEAAR